MNQRIRQLAEQAGMNIVDDKFSTYGKFAEKFAELIVRECVAVVDGMADPEDSERYFWAIQNASEKIKQHFGVRE